MKKLLSLAFFSLLISIGANAQLKIIEHGDVSFVGGDIVLSGGGTDDLSESTITTEAANMTADNEFSIWAINEGTETITVRAIRTEVDVVPGTANNVCWGLCPINSLDAGDEPVWIVGGTSISFTETMAPGDTVVSFAFHQEPNGNEGCSLFRMQFVDNESLTTEYASFDLLYDHDPGSQCAVGLEDLASSLKLTLAPNPSDDMMRLQFGDVDVPLTIHVSDILGQQIKTERYMPTGTQSMELSTLDMRNGVYFLSIEANNEIVKTMKFVVSH